MSNLDGKENPFYRIPSEIRTVRDLKKYLLLNDEEGLLLNYILKAPDFISIAGCKDLDGLSELSGNDAFVFNVLKTLWIHHCNRHEGTSKDRELNKRDHYLKKIKRRRGD
jgi:hypothetical protein